jgi:aldose 1-epimerase
MKSTKWFAFLSISLLINCSPTEKKSMHDQDETSSKTETDQFSVYELRNKNGVSLKLTNFGGRVISFFVPDRHGALADVVLGYDSVERYATGNPYFGAAIGRFGNRIAKGKFSLDGTEFNLAINNRDNALHGGPKGFHNVFWNAKKDSINNSVELVYLSKDGEEGYPGNLSVIMIYTLTDENEFKIDYSATTDKTTIVNLTHHSFFNLAGEGTGDILKHQLIINAKQFTPVDDGLIPSGELRDVKSTPFDFTTPHAIDERINQTDEQLKKGNGYDHNWILDKEGKELSLAAKVVEPNSGRIMEVFTTEPGLQFYSGNFLDGTDIGKGAKQYNFRTAFCLEAQHFPDSPNHNNFPTVVLKAGEVYKQTTVYRFSTVK